MRMYEKKSEVKLFFSFLNLRSLLLALLSKLLDNMISCHPFGYIRWYILHMERLKILEFPDKRLRRVSEAVAVFDQDIKTLSANMLVTMYEERGVGLAAPQVNKPIRLIVMDISEDRDQPMAFVNPVISSYEGKIESNEGCLSVPDIKTDVKRHETISLSAQDLEGNAISLDADGLLSICIQHEIDHLNGKLFIDYISDIKLQRLRKKISKQNKAARIERQKNTRLI